MGQVATLQEVVKRRTRAAVSADSKNEQSHDLLVIEDRPIDVKTPPCLRITGSDFCSRKVKIPCRVLVLLGEDEDVLAQISRLWPEKGPLLIQVSDRPLELVEPEMLVVTEKEAQKTTFQRLLKGLIRERREKQAHELLARVTHDMRSPMSVIKMACQFMKRKTKEDNQLQRYIQMILDSSAGIQTLIGDILDYSKLDQGSVTLNISEFKLKPLLESVRDTSALLAEKKGIELRQDFASDLPSTVSGDPGRLRQILGNLLSNAVKFTEEGQVSLEAWADGDTCHFKVTDSGIGIAENALDKIFEPYQQADASILSKFGGTGLGLNICQLLVKRMDGRISVESTLGEGSTFYFHVQLPRVEERSTSLSQVDWEQLQVWTVTQKCSDSWATKARELGLRFQQFTDPAAVAERARLSNPDVLIFDLEHGGFLELDRLMNCFTKQTPKVIVTTNVGQRGDGARCKAMGVRGYLTPPYGFTELQAFIQLICQSDSDELVTKHTLKERGLLPDS